MPEKPEESEALLWHVEEACRHAWPAAIDAACGAWLLRRSGGSTRRTNSVNPLRAAEHDVSTAFVQAIPFYAGYSQPILFRLPSFLPVAQAELQLFPLLTFAACARRSGLVKPPPGPGVMLHR